MGGRRGRLIPEKIRKDSVKYISEAIANGARVKEACNTVDISIRTFERWRSGRYKDARKGAVKHIPRKLTAEEEKQIIDICCSQEYKDKNPYVIQASLLDKSTYIASISSFYRVLKKNGLLRHRGNTRPSQKHSTPPERVATGPNQVWCWDITWLPGRVKGTFFYAYVIIDIWDRSIVKWSIHDREDDALSRELFNSALRENNYPAVFIHSDNGNPMKGTTLLSLFYDLGLCNSYSRPRVSNDNPFIEALFKTLKYSSSYPRKFHSLIIAREWFSSFVDGYNTRHSHSGMNFITPLQMRRGAYNSIAQNRNKTMVEARNRNPQRWSQNPKQLPEKHIVFLNPTADTRLSVRGSKKVAA